MSEYEVYWLTDIPYNLLGTRHEIIMVISQKKQTNKYKEKLVMIGIIVIKSKETRVITYTCMHVSLLFITMIPIDCKITNFSL